MVAARKNMIDLYYSGAFEIFGGRHASKAAVAAAESAIGLAILVVMFRNRDTINVGELDSMKG